MVYINKDVAITDNILLQIDRVGMPSAYSTSYSKIWMGITNTSYLFTKKGITEQ